MTTLLNNEIAPTTLGIVYLCEYTKDPAAIKVTKELQFTTQFAALEAYANIPNPESQLATGKNREDLLSTLDQLHKNMCNKVWLKAMADFI